MTRLICTALAGLLFACGAADGDDLGAPAGELSPPALPEDALFGYALDSVGDLTAVLSVAVALEPTPEVWTGAVDIYRRTRAEWVHEAQVEVPASFLISGEVHVVDGAVVVVAPMDGRCEDEGGAARARSGSLYVFEEAGPGWQLTAHVCAPSPETGLGVAHARVGAAVFSESAERYGLPRGRLRRLAKETDGTWRLSDVAWVDRLSRFQGLHTDGSQLARLLSESGELEVEVRSPDRPETTVRRLPCPRSQHRCGFGMSPGRLFVVDGTTLTQYDEDDTGLDFPLAGADTFFRVVSHRTHIAVLDEQGQVFILRIGQEAGPIAPSLGGLCAEGISTVALSDDATLVACAREHRVWVVPHAE